MSNSLVLDYDQAHNFVTDQQRLGARIRWEGYDIVVFYPNPKGWTSPLGVYRDAWGFEVRVPVGDDGKWQVSNKHVRSTRGTRARSR